MKLFELYVKEWVRACGGSSSGQVSVTMSAKETRVQCPQLKKAKCADAHGEAIAMSMLRAIVSDGRAMKMFSSFMEMEEKKKGNNHRMTMIFFPNWREAEEVLTLIRRDLDDQGGKISTETLVTLHAFTLYPDASGAKQLVKPDQKAGRLLTFDPDAPKSASGTFQAVLKVAVVADPTDIEGFQQGVCAYMSIPGYDKEASALMDSLKGACKGKLNIPELCSSLGMTIEEAAAAYSDAIDNKSKCTAGSSCINKCAEVKLMRCSACMMTKYCSEACQNQDWKKHRARCGLLALVHAGMKKRSKEPEASTSMDAQERFECKCCGASDVPLKVCAGCKVVWYCGPECQKKDWKEGGENKHKIQCPRIKEQREIEKKDFAAAGN